MAVTLDFDLYRSSLSGFLESGVNPDDVYIDGIIYTITGTGFGTRTGYADHIRNTSIMTLPEYSNFGAVGRWNGGNYGGASERFQVVNEGLVGKCLKATRGSGGEPNISLAFNYDSAVPLGSKVFTSVWVKHLVTGSTTGGQWKFSRWQKSTSSLSDKASECYWNASSATPDQKIQVRDYRGVSSAGDLTKYGGRIADLPHAKNKWIRMDVLHTLPSAYASPDEYKYELWVHDPDGLDVPYYTNFTNNQAIDHVNPYGQAGDEWLQHLFQNYLGNGDFDAANHTLWMDNCYESVGDDKRVELANNADLTLATRRFIVPEISWSDTVIQVRGYTGGMTGSRWLHTVVNGVSTSVRAV